MTAHYNSIRGCTEKNIEAISDFMRAFGIKQITSKYYGGGDSGGVEDVEITEGDESVNIDSITAAIPIIDSRYNYDTQKNIFKIKVVSFRDAIHHVTYDAIDAAGYSGWENDEGGGGEFVINDDNTATLRHYHNEDVTRSLTESVDLKDPADGDLIEICKKIICNANNEADLSNCPNEYMSFEFSCDIENNELSVSYSYPFGDDDRQVEADIVEIIKDRVWSVIDKADFEIDRVSVDIFPKKKSFDIHVIGLYEDVQSDEYEHEFGEPYIEEKPAVSHGMRP